ncbi:type IV secretion system protein VirB3 [Neorickettsia helminthoeca]|nr:type IV secretion system protein VirB3 [Neorickettsia helminthoeca]
MAVGSLGLDPLFKGLTRPAMFLGVSFTFSAMNLIISLLGYILTKNLFILIFFMPVIHGIGYAICFNEPLFLELFLVRNQKCMKCKNRAYHNGNSYDVF